MIDQEKLIEVLSRVLGEKHPEHNIIAGLYSACAFTFAYPEEVGMRDQIVLREAYKHLREKGTLV